MECKNKCKNVGLSAILWAVIAVVLCAAPANRAGFVYESGPIYVPPGDGYYWVTTGVTIDLYASGSYQVYIDGGGKVNFQPDSSAGYVFAYEGCQLNMYGGTVTSIIADQDVDLTIYGTYDSMVSDPIGEGHWDATTNQLVVDDPTNGWNGDLTFTYEGDTSTTTLSFTTYSNIIVEVAVPDPSVDIKPGSYPNAINLGSHGVIPVGILSGVGLDASTIDPSKVYLEGTSVAVRGKGNKYMAHTEDVNNDGLMDMVVQIETENLDPDNFQDGWATVAIKDDEGNTIFEDSDEIVIVPPDNG